MLLRVRLGLHASADSDLAELVEGLVADPGCQNFFLSDGRDPVDLPSTWAEARESADTICREEFEMPEKWCIAKAQEVFPESLLDDASMDITSEMREKLRHAVLAGSGTSLAGRSTSLEESVRAAPLTPEAMSMSVECDALHGLSRSDRRDRDV